jgi:glycosyltransferase involved in cell wall biosynthesis
LRVLMISTSYPASQSDWKGRFIADMVESVAHRSNLGLMAWLPPGELPHNTSNVVSPHDQEWLAQMQSDGGFIHLLRNKPFKGLIKAFSLIARLRSTTTDIEFEVAHINWLQNALPLWKRGRPMLVTVLGSDYGLLRIPGMVFLLRQVFKQNKCILAPNAEWMAPKLQACFGDIAEIRPIPFGVHQRFIESERNPSPNPHWLAVTRITPSKIGQLFEWGKPFFGPKRELHLLGPMQENIDLPNWIKWHGPTNPDELAKSWFPNVSGLITLSQHDEGRPQVMLDAMAAGLPVIASAIPAHQDLIQHAKTGWIVDSAESFGEALHILENSSINISIGNAARQYVLNTVGTWADCADRYEQAYLDLLAQHGK